MSDKREAQGEGSTGDERPERIVISPGDPESRKDPAGEEEKKSGSDSKGERESSGAGKEKKAQDGKGEQGREKGKEQNSETGGEQGEGGQEKKQGKEKEKGQDQSGKSQPSTPEWVVGIACALLVLALLGYLFYQALSGPSLPPIISVRAERVLPLGGEGYLVEFTAINRGTSTAQNLSVEGVLKRDTATVERSSATVQFVPAATEREGGLYFTKDPRLFRLEIRPTGYDRP